MQYLKLSCPNPACRVVLAVPEEMQGQRVRCAGCGEQLLVPPAGMVAGRTARRRSKDEGRRSAA